MLTITGKTLGQRKPLFADFSVPVPPLKNVGDTHTLRSLISHIVRDEVAAFHERQEEKRLLKALTAKQIQEGLQQGKVDMGGHDEPAQHVDPDAAVATALEAFADGLFLTIIDGEECTELDAPLTLTPQSHVTFVRLTLLAGG